MMPAQAGCFSQSLPTSAKSFALDSSSSLHKRRRSKTAAKHIADQQDAQSDSSDDEEPLEQAEASSSTAPPRTRKRPHLDSTDVGRFASMSIAPMMLDLDDDNKPQREAPPNTPSLLGESSFGAPPTTPTVMPGTPTTWEIDQYRTYVGSLDDDEEEYEVAPSPSRRGSKATIPITRQEAEELERVKTAKDPTAMHEGEADERCLEVNPELLAKLEAHSQALLVDGDMSRRRRREIADAESRGEGALVLWKSPLEVLQRREAGSSTTSSSASSSSTVTPTATGQSTPVRGGAPHQVFSFGHAASPSVPFSPVFTGATPAAAAAPGLGEMEMD